MQVAVASFPSTQRSLEEVLQALQLPSLNWVQQENEKVRASSGSQPCLSKTKEANRLSGRAQRLGAGGGSSQLVYPCLVHTHLPDLQPWRERKGVWKVRQSMGGASALANCSGSDLWETNEGRTWNLSGPGPHPIGQDTVPCLIRVLAWESAI